MLLLSSLDMIRAQKSPLKETPEEFAEGMSKDDIAITPLAVPLLAGPGAITTSIVLGGKAANIEQKVIFYALISLVALISYWTLTLAADSAKKLSPRVSTKLGIKLAKRAQWLLLSVLDEGCACVGPDRPSRQPRADSTHVGSGGQSRASRHFLRRFGTVG